MKLYLLILLSGTFLFTSAKDYKGAEYRTKASYLYGRFEVNYKAPQHDGVLASFFTYYDGGGGTSTWNEIDIEILGRYYDDVQFNTITPGQQNHVRHQSVKFNPSATFNTYAFEWTPDYVAWFINGIEVHRQTGSHIQTLTRAQKIMMNIWIPQYENWAGVFNPEALPAFGYYDWVKYYSYSPGSGNSGSNNNFTLQWTDNFDSFNTDRWAKATHTWAENLCDFIPENVVFRDGKMILCLTDAVNIGYTDLKSPLLLYARASSNKIRVEFTEELDSLSSQTTANYVLPGYTIQSAVLQDNRKTVLLNIPGLNLTQSTNLLVLNVKDFAGNKMSSKAVSVIPGKQFQFPVRINVGGASAYQDFLLDQEFSPATEYGYTEGTAGSYGTAPINGTEDDQVYFTDRYGLTKYFVRLPEGKYDIQLWFTENYFSAVEQRKFDVFLEAEKKIEDLDLYASAGFRYAYPLTFTNIDVTDGTLDIHFSAEINNPLINGIVITQNPSSIKDENLPSGFGLNQNYPNPFNSGTIIKFNMGEENSASFEIFNILGQKVYSRQISPANNNVHEIKLDASAFSSGVYLYMLKGENNLAVKKMVLLK